MKPPTPPVAPPASIGLREERDALTQRRDHQAALLAATERKRQRAEIERDEKITKLRDQMYWTIRPRAEKIWRKAQVEFPDDHDLAVQAARKELRREVNYWVHSRVWPEMIDREFKRIIAETFKPAPTVEASEQTDPIAPPISQPDPTLPPALRRKSGPSGP